MVTGIIGRKVGMTQVFLPDGTVVPATVIKAGPCVVVQAKNKQTDGYEAVQLGLVEKNPPRRAVRGLKRNGKLVIVTGNPPRAVRRETAAARERHGGRSPGRRRARLPHARWCDTPGRKSAVPNGAPVG